MSTDTPHDETAGDQPTITVAPREPTVTDTLDIRVTGLEPGQHVTLAADFSDLGTRWASEATFRADADGAVALPEDAPVDGDYAGTRPMGLVQFAERVGDAPVDLRAGTDATDLELRASVDGDCVASTTVSRAVAPGVERQRLDPDRDGVAGDLYRPTSGGPHPGVVAFHGSGGEPAGRRARVLAANGFAVLALRYFGGPPPVPEHFGEVPVDYATTAVDWLRARDGVASGDVGLFAASRGTELAFLTAAHRDDVGAVAAFTPSAYAWPGRPRGDGPPPSAWVVDGDPHPIVPRPGPDAGPTETPDGIRPRAMFAACIEGADVDALAAARLPFEDIDADVLLVSGRDDGVWPAPAMAETIREALADTPGSVTHHCYDDAGHSIRYPYHPATERAVHRTDHGPDVVHGGTPAGSANADCDAWPATLDAFESLRD